MANYKVPQDVEADDKLLGPFTFRQFIYLIIVVALGFVAWGLAQLSIVLVVIPLPPILLFGALALPLRKDQPMEIYLAAIVSFYLKPHKRLWDPDGVDSLIEITAPRTVVVSLTKDLSQHEAEQRLSYLANIVDSGGWAIRGVGVDGSVGSAVNNDIYLEAQEATDVLDINTTRAHNFDSLMDKRSEQIHQEAKDLMLQASQQSQAFDTPPQTAQFNPYPDFQQSVIQPLNDPNHQAYTALPAHQMAQPSLTPQLPPNPLVVASTTAAPISVAATAPNMAPATSVVTATAPNVVAAAYAAAVPTAAVPNNNQLSTSDSEFTAGIINLANNNPDLSIETLAHQADRLKKKAKKAADADEIVLSLR